MQFCLTEFLYVFDYLKHNGDDLLKKKKTCCLLKFYM